MEFPMRQQVENDAYDASGDAVAHEVAHLEALLRDQSRKVRDLEAALVRQGELFRELTVRVEGSVPVEAVKVHADDIPTLRHAQEAAVRQALEAEAGRLETQLRLEVALAELAQLRQGAKAAAAREASGGNAISGTAADAEPDAEIKAATRSAADPSETTPGGSQPTDAALGLESGEAGELAGTAREQDGEGEVRRSSPAQVSHEAWQASRLRIATLEEALLEAQAQARAAEAQLAQAQGQLAQQQSEQEASQAQVRQVRGRLFDTEAQLNERGREESSLREALGKLETAQASHEEQAKSERLEREQLQQTLTEVEQAREQAQQSARELEQDLQQVREALKQAEQSLSGERQAVEESRRELEQSRSRLVAAEREAESAGARAVELETQVEDMSNRLQQAQAAVQESESDLQRAQEEVASLKVDLDTRISTSIAPTLHVGQFSPAEESGDQADRALAADSPGEQARQEAQAGYQASHQAGHSEGHDSASLGEPGTAAPAKDEQATEQSTETPAEAPAEAEVTVLRQELEARQVQLSGLRSELERVRQTVAGYELALESLREELQSARREAESRQDVGPEGAEAQGAASDEHERVSAQLSRVQDLLRRLRAGLLELVNATEHSHAASTVAPAAFAGEAGNIPGEVSPAEGAQVTALQGSLAAERSGRSEERQRNQRELHALRSECDLLRTNLEEVESRLRAVSSAGQGLAREIRPGDPLAGPVNELLQALKGQAS